MTHTKLNCFTRLLNFLFSDPCCLSWIKVSHVFLNRAVSQSHIDGYYLSYSCSVVPSLITNVWKILYWFTEYKYSATYSVEEKVIYTVALMELCLKRFVVKTWVKEHKRLYELCLCFHLRYMISSPRLRKPQVVKPCTIMTAKRERGSACAR